MLKFIFASVATLLLCSCQSSKMMKDNIDLSKVGYIGNYNGFKQHKKENGRISYGFATETLKKSSFESLIIDPVIFYPEPRLSKRVDLKLLKETAAYIEKQLALKSPMPIVQKPSPKALRITPVISAIVVTYGDIRVGELFPFGSAIGLTRELLGIRHKNIEIYIELKLSDSVTGQFLGGSVSFADAAEIWGLRGDVRFSDLKSTLDYWIKGNSEDILEVSKVQHLNEESE